MTDDNARAGGSAREVLFVFTKLGLTSFGGPISHLGYFRQEFVVRRRWLEEQAYADLVSLCQFLPGPASSQVGFSIGLLRAGYRGALAAWMGFTLPSVLLLLLFASMTQRLQGPLGIALLHGLKLVAVAIVAQAVWTMARTLCPDWRRGLIAIVAGAAVLLAQSQFAQVLIIFLGGVVGTAMRAQLPSATMTHLPPVVSRRGGSIALILFCALMVGLSVLRDAAPGLTMFEAFYRSGALVFGGGHVVLPLLNEAFVDSGWTARDDFLAGYGAAQAMPGPLFAFGAYLGALATPSPGMWSGAAIGVVGIFLPGMLVLLGTLPFWRMVCTRADARAAMMGINAATVGLLGAAWCNPVWSSSVANLGDALLAAAGFLLLVLGRAPPLAVVGFTAAGAIALAAYAA